MDPASDRSSKYDCEKAFRGIPKGGAENFGIIQTQSASPLGRLGSPRTIREVLGDSLHPFSSVRKDVIPWLLGKLIKI